MIAVVLCAGTFINGRTFQPCPRSLEAPEKARSGLTGSGTLMAPLPFSPVGFSGETWRDSTLGVRTEIESAPPIGPCLCATAITAMQSSETTGTILLTLQLDLSDKWAGAGFILWAPIGGVYVTVMLYVR